MFSYFNLRRPSDFGKVLGPDRESGSGKVTPVNHVVPAPWNGTPGEEPNHVVPAPWSGARVEQPNPLGAGSVFDDGSWAGSHPRNQPTNLLSSRVKNTPSLFPNHFTGNYLKLEVERWMTTFVT